MSTDLQVDSIDISGRRFSWRSMGRGEPLVLINGYAGSSTDWDPVLLAKLSGAFRLICPDNRGLGDSELGLTSEVTVEGMASDIDALLHTLAIERTAVLGWSMGGFVAQQLALQNPTRVSALVLLATDPGGSLSVLPDPAVWAMLTDHSGTWREQAWRLISMLFPPDLAPTIDSMFGEVVAEARESMSSSALCAQESVIATWHSTEPAHPTLDSCRVLAVSGSEDVVIPPENAEALATRWPSCRVEHFTGGGHAFMAQNPAWLADLVEKFLNH